MERQAVNKLNRRLLKNHLAKKSDLAEEEITVLAKFFFDEQHFILEKEALFLKSPQPVAFSSEVSEPNSYLALDILNFPVVLTRDHEGTLRAFINACAHRGAKVATGKGKNRRLTCEFHGWSYGMDGKLTGRPQESCFSSDKSECSLVKLAVSEECGIILVGLAENMPVRASDAGFSEIAEELTGFKLKNYRFIQRKEYEVAANWKLINNLSLESYHFATLHRETVAKVLSGSSIFDTFNRCSRWAFPLLSIERLEKLEEHEWPSTVQGSCTYTLYPGVMVIVNASGAQMIRTDPGEKPNSTRISYIGLAHPDASEDAARSGYEFGGKVFEEEDLRAAINCQKGLEASKRNLIIGTNEPLLQFWHSLWSDATK